MKRENEVHDVSSESPWSQEIENMLYYAIFFVLRNARAWSENDCEP